MRNYLAYIFIALFVFGFSPEIDAQKKKKKKGKTEETQKPKAKSEIKDIDEVTKACKKIDGLFTMYQDTTNGKTFIEISEDQIGKEFIYFSYIENGVLDAFAFKGAYRSSKIFKIEKYYDRIEFVLENTRYYFDENNEISKAADSNINTPIVLSEKVEGENKDKNKWIIKGESVFMAETFSRMKPNYPPTWKGFKLGKPNKDKSKTVAINNYPENTDVRVMMAYEGNGNNSRVSRAATDGRFVNVTYHQSLIAVPENDYKPRRDDPRVGYFMTQVTDLTNASVTPYRDMIHRWHLKKKNPGAAMSEPVEPITWWIENTTPKEIRGMIKEGVEQWNQSFEKAGFQNAVVVKEQPDDAEWDAGDIRYNVLRWTSSPVPPFGGYGPSFVNPRTGQILGADIMLEYIYILGRLRQGEIFETAGLGLFSEEQEELPHFGDEHHYCSAGSMMQEEVLFAQHAMAITELDEIEKDRFLKESIQRLVLHEVGHTLGLNHNMKGSSIQSVEDLKNMDKMKDEGMCNSVMEYPAINFALNKEEQTLYYDYKPGFYDDWVIEYGYSEALEDSSEEEKRLQEILSRSNDPKLVFGNDADDMRSSGKAIDPMVNIYDLSNDPVAYGLERIELVEDKLIPDLLEKFSKEGQSYMELLYAYYTLTGQKAIQLNIMTRQIGGVHVNRSYEEQNSDKDPYTPVDYETQKAAMQALSKHAFAPDAWEYDEELIRHLQMQRRGFNQPFTGEDPKIHERISGIQGGLMRHLLHPNVLNRISNTSLYGNEYSLMEYMNDLTDAVYKSDQNRTVNSVRQNLQINYANSLVSLLENKKLRLMPNTKSVVLYQLNRIKRMASATGGNLATKAHRDHLKLIIKKALEA